HEELWRLAEYRAVFGEGAGPADPGDSDAPPVLDTRGGNGEGHDGMNGRTRPVAAAGEGTAS
ncbi:hypothetical protein C1J00_16285, partial [Streptomyces cahuitamycinicus]